MTTMQISQNIRPGRVVAIIDQDGRRLGHVVCKGLTFQAVRKTGTDQDIRRVGRGFRTVQTAAAWVAASAA